MFACGISSEDEADVLSALHYISLNISSPFGYMNCRLWHHRCFFICNLTCPTEQVEERGEKGKPKNLFRRIEAIQFETNEPICFLINLSNLTASDITELYKRRWDIEVYFKFIKQLLNFKHLISRNENGIKVM